MATDFDNGNGEPIRLSIVIPVFNEEDSVTPLIDRIQETAGAFTFSWELILVDDGSTDATWARISGYVDDVPELRVIRLRRNFGQTAAMVAGFDHSRGEVIVTLDGDLQNDPTDIPKLLAKYDEGYDIVSGWRKDRHDHWSRVFPSRVANALISLTTGVKLHDYGCSLKAYRGDSIRSLHCYGEMHRFFPALARMTGARVTEIPVKHHPRRFGESKYGFNRINRVFIDIVAINLLIRFSSAPLHGFLLLAVPFVLASMIAGGAALLAWFLEWQDGKALFFSFGCVLSLLGAMVLLSLGILGEMVVAHSDLSHTRLAPATSRMVVFGGQETEEARPS